MTSPRLDKAVVVRSHHVAGSRYNAAASLHWVTAHGVLVKITYALIVLHLAAAMRHQLFDTGRITGRMPPLPRRLE